MNYLKRYFKKGDKSKYRNLFSWTKEKKIISQKNQTHKTAMLKIIILI